MVLKHIYIRTIRKVLNTKFLVWLIGDNECKNWLRVFNNKDSHHRYLVVE